MKHECNQEKNIEEIKGKVAHIDKTLFFGNGNPPIVAQLTVIHERFNSLDKKLDNIVSYGRAAVLALLAVLGATAWDMVKRYHAESANDNRNNETVKMEVSNYERTGL